MDECTTTRIAWLAGDVGSGKTRLLRRLERALKAEGRACVYVPVPTLDAESLQNQSVPVESPHSIQRPFSEL